MKGDYPKSLIEFEDSFKTEEDCIIYLEKIRWQNGFKCPRCKSKKAWKTKRHLFNCCDCGLQTSVTSGTIFHRSRKPLRLWFRAIWHITNQKYGANALGLQRILKFGSYHTAWEWLHKLRHAMVRPNRERLSGTVEVDETYIGGSQSGKKGRGAEGKSLVAIAVELEEKNKIGRIRLQRIKDASSIQLNSFVLNNIERESIILTDGWRGYGHLKQVGYIHRVIKSSVDVGTNDKNMLPNVHLISSLIKRWLLGTYQGALSPEYLDYYLDEYTFRFNRRKSNHRGKLFYRLIQQAAQIEPKSFKT
jgi:transposase-like protein